MWREFVQLAEKRDEPFAALCARFGISRKTGYKWLNRFRLSGEDGLKELSRRPKHIPRRTPELIVDAVLELRRSHPDWTAARIREALAEEEVGRLPGLSTIGLILKRQKEAAVAADLDPERHRGEANYRWILEQAALPPAEGRPSAVLALLRDECTDYLLDGVLLAESAEESLLDLFGRLVSKNGAPWRLSLPRSEALRDQAPCRAFDSAAVWLAQRGVAVEFRFESEGEGEPAKASLERRLASLPDYQRSLLQSEARSTPLAVRLAAELARSVPGAAQEALERLVEAHNFGGKQEALQRQSPLSRYRPGELRPPSSPEEEPVSGDAEARLVSEKGIFTFQRRLIHVGRPFAGVSVELTPSGLRETYSVRFRGHHLGSFSLAGTEQDGTTSLQLLP